MKSESFIQEEKREYIVRPQLYDKLHHGLNHKLTLVTGAAGNGKSVLLEQWAQTVEHPVCWISIQRENNQLESYWKQVLTALRNVLPQVDLDVPTNEKVSKHKWVTTILDLLNRYNGKLVIILDDFHTLTNEQLLDSIDYFLKNIPQSIHVYLLSRTYPHLSMSKLRLNGDLHELHEQELRFTYEEIKQFFHTVTPLHLEQPLLTFIQFRTEGWAAGIRMIAILLQSHQEQGIIIDQALLQSLTGGHEHIAGYFMEEVYTALPPDNQLNLLQTSVLEKMNIPLIEAVSENDHGQIFIRYLEKENLFLVPMDYNREWFRYHRLFREFLETQLLVRFPDMKKDVHFKAAVWLEEKGHTYEALDHYIEAEVYGIAFRLLKRMAPTLLKDEQPSLSKRLHKMPNELLFTDPNLYLVNLASLYISGYKKKATAGYWWAIERLDKKTSILSKEKRKLFFAGLDFLVAFRSFLEKDFHSFLLYSKRYLKAFPKGDLFVNFGADKDGHHMVWDVFISEEYPQEADTLIKEAIDLWEQTENRPFYAHLCMDYANLLYEKNHHREATRFVEQALYIGSTYHTISLIFSSKMLMAKIAVANGQKEKAKIILNELEKKLSPKVYPNLIRQIKVFMDFLYIKAGDVDEVIINQSYYSLQINDDNMTVAMFNEYYIFAYLLSLNNKLNEAILLLDRLIEIAERKRILKAAVRCKIQKSCFLYEDKQYVESYQILESALATALQEGYIRTILDEGFLAGEVIRHYIHAVQQNHFTHARRQCFDYAKEIMGQFMFELRLFQHIEGADDRPLGDILLTAKEQIVLNCIDQGLSNREIAAELHVSLSTVKTHINHLYRKLDVNNRVLAIQRAREMGLL